MLLPHILKGLGTASRENLAPERHIKHSRFRKVPQDVGGDGRDDRLDVRSRNYVSDILQVLLRGLGHIRGPGLRDRVVCVDEVKVPDLIFLTLPVALSKRDRWKCLGKQRSKCVISWAGPRDRIRQDAVMRDHIDLNQDESEGGGKGTAEAMPSGNKLQVRVGPEFGFEEIEKWLPCSFGPSGSWHSEQLPHRTSCSPCQVRTAPVDVC